MTSHVAEKKKSEAFITPSLLTWARERAGLDLEAASRRLGIKSKRLEAWERGDERPTLKKAQQIAHKFNIPFGYLFLSTPPVLTVPIPDLRTMTGEPPSELSPEFYDVLNDAFRKQDWYRGYLQEQGVNVLPFVGRFSVSSPIHEVATDLNKTMEISTVLRKRSSNWEDFLRGFISKSEELGVIVLRNSVVGNNTSRHLNRNEFRGFVISDSVAPLIFLNGDDWKSAQIFTLAHELAHLWIDESGISNPNYRGLPDEQSHSIERVCDRIATDALVPQTDFFSGWDVDRPINKNIEFLTRYFKVSRLVILRRALELERISREDYWAEYDNLYSNNGSKEVSASQGGGNFYSNLLMRNSNTFTNTVVDAVLSGQLLDRDAAYLLNIQVPIFERLVRQSTGEE